MVVIYVQIPGGFERRVATGIHLGAEQELPVIFVVLPAKRVKSQGKSDAEQDCASCGVPGITVDGAMRSHFIGWCRSRWRGRGGGGPVLIECVPFHV